MVLEIHALSALKLNIKVTRLSMCFSKTACRFIVPLILKATPLRHMGFLHITDHNSTIDILHAFYSRKKVIKQVYLFCKQWLMLFF